MHNEPIRSSDQLIQRAIQIAKDGRPKTVVVAAAQDADVIEAIAQSQAKGFLSGVLVGDRKAIERLAGEQGIDIGNLEIIDHADPLAAAHQAVKLASTGKADVIMKGFLATSAILKVVLDKRYNLRGENTLSHCAVLDIRGYHRLLNVTDGGMVVKPDLEQKIQILQNALVVARALGCVPAKVAVSSAVCQHSDMPPERHAELEAFLALAKTRCTDIVLQGPLTLDAATSIEAARSRKAEGPVAGEADVYLVDSVEEGNIISKTLIQFAGAVFAGVIVGAKVPVSLVSRTDTVKNKMASLAVACVVAEYQRRSHMEARP
ncbi:MAG: phosphate butyryltransferase [candidate division Zixibacteria bacterium]|nr:phosphate butyryltransferase [candidate division Zixibacteria bacterium]